MGNDEHPEAFMRRTCFSRRECASRRREAHFPKLSQHGLEPEADMTGDVLEEDPFEPRPELAGDAGDMGPEVAGIVGAPALACGREGLAGVSGEQGVDRPGEGAGVKCGEVIPYRGGGEVSGSLGGNEDGARPVLPFDECAGVEAGLGEHEAHIQSSAARAEGEAVPGT